jgi:hypothetical protein
MSKKTLIVGASTNPDRYSYKALIKLRQHGHEVVAYSNKEGELLDVIFITNFPNNEDIDTVTMYVGPKSQKDIIPLIESLKPKRVIFNPGTENDEAYEVLKKSGILYEEACTLVLLNLDLY